MPARRGAVYFRTAAACRPGPAARTGGKILERKPTGGIEGLELLLLPPARDGRGAFVEVFRSTWLPGIFGGGLQLNCSTSSANVLRGLHFHDEQWDLWFTASGRVRAALADLRPDSRTFMKTCMMELDAAEPVGVLIPPGVAHGYLALGQAVVFYVVNRFYDGTDEHGIAWNDPALGLDWGVDSPVLSERDRNNPRLPLPRHDGGRGA